MIWHEAASAFRPTVVWRVWVLLCFEAYSTAHRVGDTAFATHAVEEVASVELDAWSGGEDLYADACGR